MKDSARKAYRGRDVEGKDCVDFSIKSRNKAKLCDLGRNNRPGKDNTIVERCGRLRGRIDLEAHVGRREILTKRALLRLRVEVELLVLRNRNRGRVRVAERLLDRYKGGTARSADSFGGDCAK